MCVLYQASRRKSVLARLSRRICRTGVRENLKSVGDNQRAVTGQIGKMARINDKGSTEHETHAAEVLFSARGNNLVCRLRVLLTIRQLIPTGDKARLLNCVYVTKQ